MTDIKKNIENIKREIPNFNPSRKQILKWLNEIKAQTNSDTEYYDILGEIFSFHPKYYMTYLYSNFKSQEMTRYLIENLSLYENEHILYEFPGKIKQTNLAVPSSARIVVKGGFIYITNLRIIAYGKLSVGGGGQMSHSYVGQAINAQRAKKAQKSAKKRFYNNSFSQELPCYGYQFNSRNHFGLKKKKKAVKYYVLGDLPYSAKTSKKLTYGTVMDATNDIKITPPRLQVDELYDILRKDVDQVVGMFQGFNDKLGFVPAGELGNLWKFEEYKDFSDSDYVDIAMRVYDLNPEHFMTKIYPKMQKWKFPPFLKIKEIIFKKLSEI